MNQHEVLRHGARSPPTDSGVPLVLRYLATNRLGQRMDRLHTTASSTAIAKHTLGRVPEARNSTDKTTPIESEGSSSNQSVATGRTTPKNKKIGPTRRIPQTRQGIQQTTSPEIPRVAPMGPCHRLEERCPHHTFRENIFPHAT